MEIYISKTFVGKTALVYAGEGTGSDCTHQLMGTMKDLGFTIECVTAKQIKEGSVFSGADVFCMPGGADLSYCEDLNGKGNEQITEYVQGGGLYFGICAGSYFAAKRLSFNRNTDLIVDLYSESIGHCLAHLDSSYIEGARELGFFPDLARGPAFNDYMPGTVLGERNATVSYSDSALDLTLPRTVRWNGGGYFVDACKYHNTVEVVAKYKELPDNPAAIVICKVSRGCALLSGLHPEYPISSSMDHLRLMKYLLESSFKILS